jgi:hypothetical protein
MPEPQAPPPVAARKLGVRTRVLQCGCGHRWPAADRDSCGVCEASAREFYLERRSEHAERGVEQAEQERDRIAAALAQAQGCLRELLAALTASSPGLADAAQDDSPPMPTATVGPPLRSPADQRSDRLIAAFRSAAALATPAPQTESD